jgi:hypothetical protein
LHPVANQPLPLGTIVSVSINDAGRAALGGSMGPEIGDIEGRLLQKDSAEYVLAVTQLHLLRGGEQVWSGERIRIKTEFVNTVAERRFSRGRTAALSAAAVGVVAIMFSQAIRGAIAGDEGKAPPDSGISIKYPRFGRK